MNSWTDIRSIISFLTLFACLSLIQSQTVVNRSGQKLSEPAGKLHNINAHFFFYYLIYIYCLQTVLSSTFI